MKDISCIADGLVVSADPAVTGLNNNEIIDGPTGSGKSVSNVYSRLVHTHDSSVVVTLSKKDVKSKFSKMFEDRGYTVLDLDLTCPMESQVGYDPFDFVRNDDDLVQLANAIIESTNINSLNTTADPYWNNSACDAISACMGLVMLNANYQGKRPSISDFITLYQSMKTFEENGTIKTNLDVLFERAEKEFPGNRASERWRTIKGLASKTASCVFSTANTAINNLFVEGTIAIMNCKKKIDLREIGRKKTVLFITISPVQKTHQNFLNLLYADFFRELLNFAESRPDGRLPVPTHIICDDFACTGKVGNFENYISIFRAAGISVSLLIQSESQLVGIYGKEAATTIINNCDTYIYMGGMDIATCEGMSKRSNKALSTIIGLPKEYVIVCRRGSEPKKMRRYQTLDDPEYLKVMGS